MPASLLAILAIFSVQFGNAFVGSLLHTVSPLGAAALRLGFAALLLIVIVRPRFADWTRRTWLGAVALGAGLGGMNVFIYFAIHEIPLGIAVTIELLGPLAVSVAGIRRPVDACWVVLALAGIVLLGSDATGGLSLAGIGFAAAAAVCWALYILATSKLSTRVRGVDGLVGAIAFAAVIVVPLGAHDAVTAVSHDYRVLWSFAGLAVMTSVIPYALEFIAMKRMSARVFGVLSSLGPAVAALAGFVVLHQQLGVTQWCAILLVVAASAGVLAKR